MPDTPAELFDRQAGEELLDALRAPRAIEAPQRDEDGRPGGAAG